MKKLFLMMAAVVMMAACASGNGEGSNAASGEAEAPAFEFKLPKAFNGTTGNNFKAFDAFAVNELPFEVKVNGEDVEVSTTFKIKRTEEPAKEPSGVSEVWVRYDPEGGGQEIRMELKADEASQKALEEALNKPAGEEVELTFKTVAKKADLEAMNGQKTVNTFVCN